MIGDDGAAGAAASLMIRGAAFAGAEVDGAADKDALEKTEDMISANTSLSCPASCSAAAVETDAGASPPAAVDKSVPHSMQNTLSPGMYSVSAPHSGHFIILRSPAYLIT
jgi:hypothetical protein